MAIASQVLLNDNTNDDSILDQVRGAGEAGTLIGGSDTETQSRAGPIGKINTSLLFEGVFDYIDLYTDPASGAVGVVTDKSFSFTGWFKTSYSGSTQRYIVSETRLVNDRYASLGILNGKIVFTLSALTVVAITGKTNVDDDKWHFVAGTSAGNGNAMTLYVDDRIDAAVGVVPSGTMGIEATVIGQLELTAGVEAGGFWQGNLADIRFYDAPLTADEVQGAREEMLGFDDGSQNSIYVPRVAYARNSVYRDNGSPLA